MDSSVYPFSPRSIQYVEPPLVRLDLSGSRQRRMIAAAGTNTTANKVNIEEKTSFRTLPLPYLGTYPALLSAFSAAQSYRL